MAYIIGQYNFDQELIGQSESDMLLPDVAHPDYAQPRCWRTSTAVLAHADFAANRESPQPYVTQSAAITFDGRLDNREDLQLILRDHIHRATSDAALVLAVYKRNGVLGFARLIGDFAFAICDLRRKHVLLATDYAGVRPLYYSASANSVKWATSLGSLVQSGRTPEIDDEFVAGFLAYGGCPRKTPFRGIHAVPPGHCVIASARGVEVSPFWQIQSGSIIRYRDESEYDVHLRELFREAVRCRLRTSRPAFIEVSGGLDSSSVATMATELVRSRAVDAPQLITLTYDRPKSNDRRFYTAVEEWCGNQTCHLPASHEQFLTEHHVGESLPAFWEKLHLSVADVARSSGAQALLTGSQGDLVMGNSWDDSVQILGFLRTRRIGAAARQTLEWSRALRVPMVQILWRHLSAAILNHAPHFLHEGSSGWQQKAAEDSLAPDFRKRVAVHRFFSTTWQEAPMERQQFVRSLTQIVELQRLKAPGPLMHLSYTHPLMHRPLLSFILAIPPEVLCGPGEPRRLMRRAFRSFWPPRLRQRRSKDVFGEVFYKGLAPIAVQFLKDVSRMEVIQRGYVDATALKPRLERLVRSQECNQSQLRLIILLELWLRRRSARTDTNAV